MSISAILVGAGSSLSFRNIELSALPQAGNIITVILDQNDTVTLRVINVQFITIPVQEEGGQWIVRETVDPYVFVERVYENEGSNSNA